MIVLKLNTNYTIKRSTMESYLAKEIKVFYTNIDSNKDYFYSQKDILSDEEKSSFENIVSDNFKLSFLAGRVILRTILSENYLIPIDSIVFDKNKYGKPFLKNENIKFNISHTGGFVVAGFSNEFNLGVDIEKIRDSIKYQQIIKRYFSDSEVKNFSKILEKDQISKFFHLWTLKESYIKCEGKGLQIPLNSFSIDFLSEKPNILFDSLKENSSLWRFFSLDISNSHRCSICVNTDVQREELIINTIAFPSKKYNT